MDKKELRRARYIVAAAIVVGASLLTPWVPTPSARIISAAGTCTVDHALTVYAEYCPGVDAGQQIAAALTALGASSGTIDASGIPGPDRYINQALTIGTPWTYSVKLVLGPGRWFTTHPITLTMGSSLVGAPFSHATTGVEPTATNLIASAGASVPAIVKLGDMSTGVKGTASVVQDIVIDGNRSAFSTVASGIRVTFGARSDLTRVTVQNVSGHGIHAGGAGTEAYSLTLTKVISLNNGQFGLLLQGPEANDTMIVQSEFLQNSRGIVLDQANATRVTASDISTNQIGIFSFAGTYGNTISGNQFGNQAGSDIQLGPGNGNVISGNQMIGSAYRLSTAAVIQIYNNFGTTVTGNRIDMGGSARPAANGLQFVTPTGPNIASGNIFTQVPVSSTCISGVAPTSGGLPALDLNTCIP